MVTDWRIVAVLVCLAAGARGGNESEFGNDHPTILVESIRRQLMNENYDYMPSESEELFPIRHELSNEATTVSTPAPAPPHLGGRANRANDLDSDINEQFIPRANDFEHKVDFKNDNSNAKVNTPPNTEDKNRASHLDSDINDEFIPRAHDFESKADFENDNSHAISKKDLLYYVDDDRLKHEAVERVEAVDEVSEAEDVTTTVVTTPKVKYKVLKIKQPHANRRSQTFRRFIQEEGEDGVAIINLNDEPFPEFRLPSDRRQYMMDQDDRHSDTDMEIAPLSDEEGDLDAGDQLFDKFHHLARHK